MERLGFIRDKLDIKVLILFILRRMPGHLSPGQLTDLVMADGGVDYFDYAQCLAELEDTGHISRNEKGWFAATDKGRENGSTLEGSLPYSVRVRVERASAPLAAAMQREAMICTAHEAEGDGVTVRMSLSDRVGEMLSLSLLVPDEASARQMEARFRADAEEVYNRITQMLLTQPEA